MTSPASVTFGLAQVIDRVPADRSPTELPTSTMPVRAPRVSVVIPALNEAECLPHVLPRLPDWVDEVLLVDGESRDATIEVARRLWPSVRIIQQQGRGKGAALRTGLTSATGDIIVMLDADGSTDPSEIPAFVGALLGGADFAKGSRFLQGAGSTDMTGLRRVGNWAFAVLANVLFQTRFSDLTYGYNALWARNRWSLALEIDGWPHEIISNIRVARSGLKVVEVASFEHARVAGRAKLRLIPAASAILAAIFGEWMATRQRGQLSAAPLPVERAH
jgi:glycosyltransferase involved in cell wall biosynthesis